METNINTEQQEGKSRGFGHFLLLFAAFIVGFVIFAKVILWLLE
jgi:hypothetical protein